MKLLAKNKKYDLEVWIQYDKSAEVYELFASKEGDDYIGCADSEAEARVVAKEHFAEWAANA